MRHFPFFFLLRFISLLFLVINFPLFFLLGFIFFIFLLRLFPLPILLRFIPLLILVRYLPLLLRHHHRARWIDTIHSPRGKVIHFNFLIGFLLNSTLATHNFQLIFLLTPKYRQFHWIFHILRFYQKKDDRLDYKLVNQI